MNIWSHLDLTSETLFQKVDMFDDLDSSKYFRFHFNPLLEDFIDWMAFCGFLPLRKSPFTSFQLE